LLRKLQIAITSASLVVGTSITATAAQRRLARREIHCEFLVDELMISVMINIVTPLGPPLAILLFDT
jgi:hypothetical protein